MTTKQKIDKLLQQWQEQINSFSIPDLILVANDWYAVEIAKLTNKASN